MYNNGLLKLLKLGNKYNIGGQDDRCRNWVVASTVISIERAYQIRV